MVATGGVGGECKLFRRLRLGSRRRHCLVSVLGVSRDRAVQGFGSFNLSRIWGEGIGLDRSGNDCADEGLKSIQT